LEAGIELLILSDDAGSDEATVVDGSSGRDILTGCKDGID
jgi:hypothetical protein